MEAADLLSRSQTPKTVDQEEGANAKASNTNNQTESVKTLCHNSNKPNLMTRKQLMNPFDSDSDEDVELMSKKHEGTASVSSTDSDDVSRRQKQSPILKNPIRKPLQFVSNYDNSSSKSNNFPSSYSTSSFQNFRSQNYSSTGLSVHSGLSKLAEPVEIAPGILDLSANKTYHLQRTFSAPTCQNSLIDSRKVCFCFAVICAC